VQLAAISGRLARVARPFDAENAHRLSKRLAFRFPQSFTVKISGDSLNLHRLIR
jgi:hypothetical protein